MYGRWNWRGLWAYGIGFAAMIPFFSTEHARTGCQALGGADIAMLVGLPVSAAVYSSPAARSTCARKRGVRRPQTWGLEPPEPALHA